MTKIAVITGGTGGIGEIICQRLRDNGYKVIATSNNPENAKNWQQQPENQGISVEQVDVSDFASCEALAKTIIEKYGVPYLLVNNAGITKDSQLKKMSVEQWNQVINTNLNSVFNMTRQFINGMLEQKSGRIINISSINGQKGQFGQANYAAAKAGMHGFTMSLAQETAKAGITVNTISPGYTGTKMVEAIREDILQSIIEQIPMKRLAQTKEIADLVVFLASEQAAYMSGANLPINGAQFTSF